MNKKECASLLKEAEKEYGEEREQRVKDFLKERIAEYEVAKETVERLERQFKELEKLEFDG